MRCTAFEILPACLSKIVNTRGSRSTHEAKREPNSSNKNENLIPKGPNSLVVGRGRWSWRPGFPVVKPVVGGGTANALLPLRSHEHVAYVLELASVAKRAALATTIVVKWFANEFILGSFLARADTRVESR